MIIFDDAGLLAAHKKLCAMVASILLCYGRYKSRTEEVCPGNRLPTAVSQDRGVGQCCSHRGRQLGSRVPPPIAPQVSCAESTRVMSTLVVV